MRQTWRTYGTMVLAATLSVVGSWTARANESSGGFNDYYADSFDGAQTRLISNRSSELEAAVASTSEAL